MPLDRARSAGEAGFVRFCREHGLPEPAVNVPLLGFEVDFLWQESGVVGELDGRHHDSPRARGSDARRDARLRAHGHRVVRFRQREMTAGPQRLARRIRRILSSAAA